MRMKTKEEKLRRKKKGKKKKRTGRINEIKDLSNENGREDKRGA